MKRAKLIKVISIGILHSTVFLGVVPYLVVRVGRDGWAVPTVIGATTVLTFIILFARQRKNRSTV